MRPWRVLRARAAVTALFALGASVPALAQTAKPVTFARAGGGTITVEDDSHVRVTDAKGELSAESWCDPPGYQADSAFLAKVQALLAQGDFDALAAQISYPLGRGAAQIRNAKAFKVKAGKLFSPAVRQRILAADPREVFCKDGTDVMLGDGVLWASSQAGKLSLTAVNP